VEQIEIIQFKDSERGGAKWETCPRVAFAAFYATEKAQKTTAGKGANLLGNMEIFGPSCTAELKKKKFSKKTLTLSGMRCVDPVCG